MLQNLELQGPIGDGLHWVSDGYADTALVLLLPNLDMATKSPAAWIGARRWGEFNPCSRSSSVLNNVFTPVHSSHFVPQILGGREYGCTQ